MAPPIHVINDTIIPSGPSYADMSPRDIDVRNAMFLLTVSAPIIAAAVLLLAPAPRTWARGLWSFPKILAAWFLSIGGVGIWLYATPGRSDRSTFVIAILHGQLEVLINCMLLNISPYNALAISWLWGMIDYALAFILLDVRTAFMTTAIIGGANDFLITSLLFYGKQYGFALGGLAHVVSAVNVFTGIVDNFGVGTYNIISFFGLWINIAFMVAGVLSVRVKNDPDADGVEPPVHPLQHVKISWQTTLKLIAFSYTGSTIVTLLLSYVAANK